LATPDEWPTPAEVHAGVDEFVNDPTNDYWWKRLFYSVCVVWGRNASWTRSL
jgi:hypothetical protein